jgi:CRP/FNR family transcriptional regulator, cyclic AMP receptor protein
MARPVPKQVIEALRALPLFAGCSDKELDKVARIGTAITVDPGYVFTKQGRRGYEFFVLVDGSAVCTIDGSEITRYEHGDFFGEMGVLEQAPRSATVTAESTATVLVIDAREFHAMFEFAPAATKRLLSTMSERLRLAQTVS